MPTALPNKVIFEKFVIKCCNSATAINSLLAKNKCHIKLAGTDWMQFKFSIPQNFWNQRIQFPSKNQNLQDKK